MANQDFFVACPTCGGPLQVRAHPNPTLELYIWCSRENLWWEPHELEKRKR